MQIKFFSFLNLYDKNLSSLMQIADQLVVFVVVYNRWIEGKEFKVNNPIINVSNVNLFIFIRNKIVLIGWPQYVIRIIVKLV